MMTSALLSAYQKYREPTLNQRRFSQKDIQPLIDRHSTKGVLKVKTVGHSVQGRPLHLLSFGDGPVSIFLWSQMHGNESTATMALFDLFNFLNGLSDEFEETRELLRTQTTLHFLPMVNPDGVEVYKRRNALDIDLNRDALTCAAPESQILKQIRERIQADWGFNLHDQQIYYNVSGTPAPATISVLAPPYDESRSINTSRKEAMQLIVEINELLQEIIPGQVGKYEDTFEPRAFGDNFQKWGTRTILIESGGYKGDPEKQYIRQLNFMAILHALNSIASKNFQKANAESYQSIPDNDLKLADLIIRKASLNHLGKKISVDIGIKRLEVESARDFTTFGQIFDLGDLSTYFGYEEFEASGYEVIRGSIYPESIAYLHELSTEMALSLVKKGYLAVKVENEGRGGSHHLPINILSAETSIDFSLNFEGPANFLLHDGKEISHAVVNGYLIHLNTGDLPPYYKNNIV
ncbi:M14 family zinc carboxypeptidase [Penaeicola halotolerans]|uniref:M14 family zinc carboxypeptidase n=1 Tax=Penaeicola halotolerans TaxID=2793196 RepID=UPI001CF85FDF|nr:M14 family zinc carboxypeptidase [Penaeicola halotolerans]